MCVMPSSSSMPSGTPPTSWLWQCLARVSVPAAASFSPVVRSCENSPCNGLSFVVSNRSVVRIMHCFILSKTRVLYFSPPFRCVLQLSVCFYLVVVYLILVYYVVLSLYHFFFQHFIDVHRIHYLLIQTLLSISDSREAKIYLLSAFCSQFKFVALCPYIIPHHQVFLINTLHITYELKYHNCHPSPFLKIRQILFELPFSVSL